MITDGGPNDEGFEDVFRELQKLEDEKRVMTLAIGVEGYNEEMLKQIMPWYEAIVDGVKQNRQRIFRIGGFNFAELFIIPRFEIRDLGNTHLADDPLGF